MIVHNDAEMVCACVFLRARGSMNKSFEIVVWKWWWRHNGCEVCNLYTLSHVFEAGVGIWIFVTIKNICMRILVRIWYNLQVKKSTLFSISLFFSFVTVRPSLSLYCWLHIFLLPFLFSGAFSALFVVVVIVITRFFSGSDGSNLIFFHL